MGCELTITWLKNRNAPIDRSTAPSRKVKKSLIGSRESIALSPPRILSKGTGIGRG
jgi:hypothetical protein